MRIGTNYSAPKFGMAMKITPDAAPFVRANHITYIKNLETVGRSLEECKFADLIIGKNGFRTIKAKYPNGEEVYKIVQDGPQLLTCKATRGVHPDMKFYAKDFLPSMNHNFRILDSSFDSKYAIQYTPDHVSRSDYLERDMNLTAHINDDAAWEFELAKMAEESGPRRGVLAENILAKYGIKQI